MRNILYFGIFILLWIYVVPHISDDYQFLFKVFLISLPILLGYSQIEEIQENFKSDNKIKKKILGQLINIKDKSTIALVYTDGTLDFLFKNEKKKPNKSNKTTPKKNNKVKSTNIKNWYNKL
jgi:hypothetical protein